MTTQTTGITIAAEASYRFALWARTPTITEIEITPDQIVRPVKYLGSRENQ